MALNTLEPLESLTFRVASIDIKMIMVGQVIKEANVLTLEEVEEETLSNTSYEFVQTEALTEAGVAVQPYGAFIMNTLAPTDSTVAFAAKPVILYNGKELEGDKTLQQLTVGATITFSAS